MGLITTLAEPNVEVFFVDEPDLYLHPPQSYTIAKIISREKKNSQLFFSTHSSRFIQALAEHAADRLLLIRLNNFGGKYSSKLINIDAFSEIRSSPILKFNNVIESIFYTNTIVCEDFSDCLFYSTCLDSLSLSKKNESTLWLGTNGKTNLAKTAYTLKKLAVDPIIVADFDLIRPEHLDRDLIPLVRDMGGEIEKIRDNLKNRIYKQVESNKKLNWDSLKLSGIQAASPFPELFEDLESLIDQLKEIRILINPFGETESLCIPRVGGHGVEAINEMLGIPIDSPKLRPAREFVAVIAGWLQEG